MNEITAAKLITDMIRITAILDATISRIQIDMEEEEYNIYKKKIATLMGEVSWEFLTPLYKEFPSLEPKSAEDWQKSGKLFQPHWLEKAG